LSISSFTASAAVPVDVLVANIPFSILLLLAQQLDGLVSGVVEQVLVVQTQEDAGF